MRGGLRLSLSPQTVRPFSRIAQHLCYTAKSKANLLLRVIPGINDSASKFIEFFGVGGEGRAEQLFRGRCQLLRLRQLVIADKMPLLLYVCWRNPRHFTRRLVTRHLRFPLCVVPNRFRCANGTSSSSFFGSSWPPQRFRLYLADGEREPNRNTQSLLCHHLRIERLS